jgi:DNA helicase HerA-like ATPase
MKKLKISPTFSLPIGFVTWTQAILAKKGSGKSYTASVEAEELLDAGQQIVVVDPVGAWHGLRSSADGKSAGYPIAVLGGEHGDVPLEPTAGEVIADAIATEHFSAIVDLSAFRKGEALRFMAAFLETLYRRNRDVLHLFIDEADTVAPQRPFGEEARTLGAAEDIVRRGRQRGIGCTLITQCPQVLSKNVLGQVDRRPASVRSRPRFWPRSISLGLAKRSPPRSNR